MISLNQGTKFNNYQNKIKKRVEKQERLFSPREDKGIKGIKRNIKETFINAIENNAQNVANINQENTQESLELAHLKNQFDTLSAQYTTLSQHLNSETTNDVNPYLGKNIRPMGENTTSWYVTNEGIAKWYPNAEVMVKTAGRNQCPDSAIFTDVKMTDFANGKYMPPLTEGTPMVSGQSCGNEGKNVWVNQIIPANTSSTYLGCYVDNGSMTFMGGSPPTQTGSLQNGTFAQPQLADDSYENVASSSRVPGWIFTAWLINNSTAWGFPMPYPSNNQAACLQSTQSIQSNAIQLTSGTYNVSFAACGRSGDGGSNTINISLVMSDNTRTLIYIITPQLTWGSYNNSFTVEQPGAYSLLFAGTTPNTSTAIQNIQLTPPDTTISEPSYTYDRCKNEAISNGYKYFALQNTNPTTGYSYCAVSNDEIGATVGGEALSATQQIPLWSSNTQGQPGNTAVLTNVGALSIVNTSGAIVFNTPNSTAQPSNYLGCYNDNPNRAMTLYNNGSQEYNLQECQQIAQDSNMMLYGLQNSTTGTNAQCVLSNNLSESQQYGVAGNCTQISDGSWSGGGMSNAIYYNPSPTSSYYLMIDDNGLLSINRGNNPSDNQGNIWSFQGTPKDKNPTYSASNSKFGQNWFFQGTTLSPGDFVSSPSGNMALIMQEDGNLVLYTFQMGSSCSKISNTEYYGGGQGANALYKLQNTGNTSLMGKIGYVDSDTILREYPDSMIGKSFEYDKIAKYDSVGNNLPNMPMTNSNVKQCTIACNENINCNGFVFDNGTNNCWLKDTNMYPRGEKQPQNNLDLYVRKPELLNSANCPKEIIPIDSIQYQNYPQGEPMAADTSCINTNTNTNTSNTNSDIHSQLMDLENQMSDLADKIGEKVNVMYSNNISVNNKIKVDTKQLDTNIKMYKDVKGKIAKLNGEKNNSNSSNTSSSSNKKESMMNMEDLNAMISDSDLLVLQNNYRYILWSILAVGSVVVTINTFKK